MSEKVTGPHEFQTIPPKALAQRLARRAEFASRRARSLPIETLGFAGKLVPIPLLRSPIALTEAVLRQILLPDNDDDEHDTQLYPGASEGVGDEAFTAPPDARTSVRSMVSELLDRSIRQSPRQAMEANYKRVVLQLLPDEVRIVNALSDGEPRVMEHVGVGSMGRSPDYLTKRYISAVGTEAGVRCPELVPDYIAHLLRLDLIEIGDEDEDLREQYEILDTYGEVDEAQEDADEEASGFGKKLKLKTSQLERHTITISKLGKDLWEYANPDTHTFAVAEQREEPDIDMDGDLPPEPE